MSFKIIPLPTAFLEHTRAEQIDALGQPVKRFFSLEGGEPCRDVLRRARPGEELILASYSPFAKVGPYKEYGPVFILANQSHEPVRFDALPLENQGFSDYFGQQLVLRAYDAEETMVEAVLVSAEEATAKAQQLLQIPEIAFVQARFPAAGCFACRIERV